MGIEEFLLERATKEGFKKGFELGYEIGFEIGKKKGLLEVKWNPAKRLKELGVSIDIIAQGTDLSLEELKGI